MISFRTVFIATVVVAFLAVGGCGGDPPASEGTNSPDSVDLSEADVPKRPDSLGEERTRPPDATVAESTLVQEEGVEAAAVLPEAVVLPAPDDRPEFIRPEHIRGIYLNAWTSGSTRRTEALVDLAVRTEVNSFVIDIKDATGYVSYPSGVPLAREIGAIGEIRISDIGGLLERLEEAGIYPIARIVIVKDPLLAEALPEVAIQDSAGGVWTDPNGVVWLNPFDERVWEYHIDLAKEAVALGFPEVQWDYVRFPDAPRSALATAVYPGRMERRRPDAIRAFLERSREELGAVGAEVTADVFGVTTTANDVGIGQIWTEFIDVVDVALPMIYPSHYWRGSFGIESPNAHPYEVVREALEGAISRSSRVEGAGETRPWLQDFTLGPPRYGAPEVRAQIEATYDVGIDEWVLWNPGSRYTEEALEPTDGWSREPWIRIAGSVVPRSGRERALELVSAASLDSVPVIPAREVPTDSLGASARR